MDPRAVPAPCPLYAPWSAANSLLRLRWHLAISDQKQSTAYLVNGIALVALFFLARIVCYGAGMIHLWGLR